MQRSLITLLFAIALAGQAQERQEINVGTPGSGTGDPLRTAFIKVNTNLFHIWNTFTNAALLHVGGIDPILQSGYVLGQGSNTVLRLDGSTVYVDALADVFTPTGDLDMASNNIVGVGALEADSISVPTLTTQLAEMAEDIGLRVPIGAYTNEHTYGVFGLHVLRPPKYASLTVTNNAVTIDREDAVDWYIKADDDLTIYDPTPPTGGETIELEIENIGASEIGLNWGDWIFRTQVVPTGLGADEKLWVVAKATPDAVYASYEYRQDQQLGTVRGGTGTVLGEAVAPISTVYYPLITAATNFSADLAYGRFARVFMDEADLYLGAISGRPASTNEMRWQEIEVWNVGATTNTIRVRPDVFTKGVPTNGLTLEPNQRELLRVMAYSAEYTNNWVFGSAGSQLVGGGGDTPSEPSLWDDAIATYQFEGTNRNQALDSESGGLHLGAMTADVFTVEQAGVNNYAWQGYSPGGALTNNAPTLKPWSAVRTYTGWVRPTSVTSDRQFMGVYDGGLSQAGFRVGWSASGQHNVRYSTNGTTTTYILQTSPAYTVNQWHFFAVVVDKDNYIKTLMANAADGSLPALSTVNLPQSLHQSTAPFVLFASTHNGAANNIHSGRMDEVTVWDGELTVPELETLYNAGSGSFRP